MAMHLQIKIDQPLSRRSEADFVVPICTDFIAGGMLAGDVDSDQNFVSDDAEPEFIVGRIWAERLDWFHAEECGYSVLDICDEASGTWMQVLETLSDDGGESFRSDLGLDHFNTEVIFIQKILLHPEIQDRVALVDASLRGMSTGNALLLMHHEANTALPMDVDDDSDWTSQQQNEISHWQINPAANALANPLSDRECHELGFRKIARSNLVLRDNHFRYPFGDEHSEGREVDFVATAEHEAWLHEQWEAYTGSSSSDAPEN